MNHQKSKTRYASCAAATTCGARITGTPERPRLTVFRSSKHIYAQLIDDLAGVTLAAASSLTPDVRKDLPYGGNVKAAKVVGQKLAEAAKEKGIDKAAFDRGHYRFHGRVKALAEAANAAGLLCCEPKERKKAKLAAKRPPRRPRPRRGRSEGKEGKEREEGKAETNRPRSPRRLTSRLATRLRKLVLSPRVEVNHGQRSRYTAGRLGRTRRQDPPLRRRGEGRPAFQLQRPGRRRRHARPGGLRLRQGQRGAAGRREGEQGRPGSA